MGLYDFILGAWHVVEPGRDFIENWHIVLICRFLEALAEGHIRRLVINIPPGHMKSLTCAVFFPSWVWGFLDPSQRFIFGSYAQALSNRDSNKCRRVCQSEWFRSVTINQIDFQADQNLKTKFENTDTGFRLATSVGGLGTGERADFIVFDDPIKVAEADSEVARYTAVDWWKNSMATRGSDPKTARFLGIAQRTHYQDVPGWCLDAGYDYLVLPSEYIPDFQISSRPELIPDGLLSEYEQSGLLWEALYGHEQLARFKEDLGSYEYAAQFQQQPVPQEGGLVKLLWFRRYRVLPDRFDTVVLSCDTAGKRQDSNDPWALLLWGVLGKDYYLVDVVCRRFEYPDGKRFLVNYVRHHRPATLLIEDASSGTFLIQELRNDRDCKASILGLRPCREKVTRMRVVTPIIEAGRVYLPENSDWVAAYETELSQFPRGEHDDRVDATSQFLAWANNRFLGTRSKNWVVSGDRSERMAGWR